MTYEIPVLLGATALALAVAYLMWQFVYKPFVWWLHTEPNFVHEDSIRAVVSAENEATLKSWIEDQQKTAEIRKAAAKSLAEIIFRDALPHPVIPVGMFAAKVRAEKGYQPLDFSETPQSMEGTAGGPLDPKVAVVSHESMLAHWNSKEWPVPQDPCIANVPSGEKV